MSVLSQSGVAVPGGKSKLRCRKEKAELLTYPLELLVKVALFAAYQATKLRDRAKEVYRILENSECKDVTMQDLFQMGKQWNRLEK